MPSWYMRADEDLFELEKECSRLLHQPGLTATDRDWLHEHFELAGLPAPTRDFSWIQMTKVRS